MGSTFTNQPSGLATSGLDFHPSNGYVSNAMRKVPEVERAKSLMTEAMDWSVFTWLFQKSRVREAADKANAALDELNRATKARWSDEVKSAYKALSRKTTKNEVVSLDPEIEQLVKKVKEADEVARRARKDAEDAFAEAERQMNTGLARQGCEKAIQQWELDAKAIRCAEMILGPAKPKR